MRRNIAALLFFLPLCMNAQVNTNSWGVEDTILTITKTVDFGVVHDYLEMTNHSGGPLDMRWICHEPSGWPFLWETDFSDPDSNYYDVQDLDSHDFVLPYPAGFSNKLIIGVDHQQVVHTDTIRFNVFPLAHPEDSLWLYYVIIIQESGAGLEEPDPAFSYQWNTETKELHIRWNQVADLSIFDLSGRMIPGQVTAPFKDGYHLDLSGLPPGVYLVLLTGNDGRQKTIKVELP